jgi:hypothetical protein
MTKLSVIYRATIDRHVPIAVRSRFTAGQKSLSRGKLLFFRERIRLS